jgi:hypothetical protein
MTANIQRSTYFSLTKTLTFTYPRLFFRVCYALVTRIKTLRSLKKSVINDVLNIRFKRFNHFMRNNKGTLWNKTRFKL